MPRTCTICAHPRRADVDAELLAGCPLRTVAKHYGTSPAALHRHKAHLTAPLVQASPAAPAVTAQGVAPLPDVSDLLSQAKALHQAALAALAETRDICSGVQELCTELLGLTRDLRERPEAPG